MSTWFYNSGKHRTVLSVKNSIADLQLILFCFPRYVWVRSSWRVVECFCFSNKHFIKACRSTLFAPDSVGFSFPKIYGLYHVTKLRQKLSRNQKTFYKNTPPVLLFPVFFIHTIKNFYHRIYLMSPPLILPCVSI